MQRSDVIHDTRRAWVMLRSRQSATGKRPMWMTLQVDRHPLEQASAPDQPRRGDCRSHHRGV